MTGELELKRFILLELERRERSPKEPFFVPLEEFVVLSGAGREEIFASLEALQEADFIEGPGAYFDQWLFRKLTHRGQILARLVERDEEWIKIKYVYGNLNIG